MLVSSLTTEKIFDISSLTSANTACQLNIDQVENRSLEKKIHFKTVIIRDTNLGISIEAYLNFSAWLRRTWLSEEKLFDISSFTSSVKYRVSADY